MTLRGILIALPISLGLWLVILNVTAGLAACATKEITCPLTTGQNP